MVLLLTQQQFVYRGKSPVSASQFLIICVWFGTASGLHDSRFFKVPRYGLLIPFENIITSSELTKFVPFALFVQTVAAMFGWPSNWTLLFIQLDRESKAIFLTRYPCLFHFQKICWPSLTRFKFTGQSHAVIKLYLSQSIGNCVHLRMPRFQSSWTWAFTSGACTPNEQRNSTTKLILQ